MDGLHGPCTAATLGPGGPSTALSITTIGPHSHGRSPTAGLFTDVAAAVAKCTRRCTCPHYVKLSGEYTPRLE